MKLNLKVSFNYALNKPSLGQTNSEVKTKMSHFGKGSEFFNTPRSL